MSFLLSEALRSTFNRTVKLLAVRVSSKQCNAVFKILRREKRQRESWEKEADETSHSHHHAPFFSLFLVVVVI